MYFTRTFRNSLFEYELSFPWENPPYGNTMNLSDFSTARQVLANFLSDFSAVSIFRSCLAGMSEVGSVAVSKLNDHQVIDKLSQLLVLGRVKLYRRDQMFFTFQERKPTVAAISQATIESTQSWVEVIVVWDDIGQPVSNLQLVIETPDGKSNIKQTDSDGHVRLDQIIEGMCEVRCGISGAKLEECVSFVCEGQEPSGKQSSSTQSGSTSQQPTTKRTGNPLIIADVKQYKVKTGDTPESIAAKAGLPWKDLATFNWGTDNPDEINKHLAKDVGCTNKTQDGKNYVFDNSDYPGLIYIPNQWKYQAGTGIKHTIRVDLVKKPGQFLDDIETLALALCIWTEARDNPDAAKRELEMRHVGGVIMNRVRTGYLKKTTYVDVVLEPMQFSHFNVESPEKSALRSKDVAKVRAWADGLSGVDKDRFEECARVARGLIRDPTTNPFDSNKWVRHYYSPQSMDPPGTAPKWVTKLQPGVTGMQNSGEVSVPEIDKGRFRWYQGIY